MSLLQHVDNVPTKIYLKDHSTLHDMLSYINSYFTNLIQVTLKENVCTWKVIHPCYIFVLSDALSFATHLEQQVLTPWDKSPSSCSPVDYTQQLPSNQSIIIISTFSSHSSYNLHQPYETFSLNKVLKKLDNYVDVFDDGTDISIFPRSPTNLCIMSKTLHDFLPFNQAGVYLGPLRGKWKGMLHIDLRQSFYLAIYNLSIIAILHTPL